VVSYKIYLLYINIDRIISCPERKSLRKIINYIGLLLFVVLLSACSSGISNKCFEEDILTLPSIYKINEFIDVVIIEETQNSTHIDYKLSTTLNAYECTITADITLHYTLFGWCIDEVTLIKN
jgi:hypothetical protein